MHPAINKIEYVPAFLMSYGRCGRACGRFYIIPEGTAMDDLSTIAYYRVLSPPWYKHKQYQLIRRSFIAPSLAPDYSLL